MNITVVTHYRTAADTALCWINPDPAAHGRYEFNFTLRWDLVTCRNCHARVTRGS